MSKKMPAFGETSVPELLELYARAQHDAIQKRVAAGASVPCAWCRKKLTPGDDSSLLLFDWTSGEVGVYAMHYDCKDQWQLSQHSKPDNERAH